MSDADNYAPGTYNDPNAPWNQEDITESLAFEDKRIEMQDERINDLNGYLIESITERSDADLKKMAKYAMDASEHASILLGKLVRDWILQGTEPSDDEVIDELQQEPDERY